MRIIKFIFKTTLIAATLSLPLMLLLTTNKGLNTVLTVASWFSPLKITYEQASGQIIGHPISITNITITQNGHILRINNLNFNWPLKSFSATKISGFEAFLPAQEYLANSKQNIIDEIHGLIELKPKSQTLNLHLDGKWQDEELKAKLQISHGNNNWRLENGDVKVGSNSLKIRATTEDGYTWDLKLQQAKTILKDGHGALNASGSITNLKTTPELLASITAEIFGFQDYKLKKLRTTVKFKNTQTAPLILTVTANEIIVSNKVLKAFKLDINGSLNSHAINSSTSYDGKPVKINANGKFNDGIWQTNNLSVSHQQETLNGSAIYNINKSNADIKLRGKIFSIATELKAKVTGSNNLDLNVNLYANAHNSLHAAITLNQNKISGTIDAVAQDLSLIMQWLPEITRLKGLFKANIKVSGTLGKPIILVRADVTNITATLPALGVKIKPMDLHITSDSNSKFVLSGKGKMRRGPGEFTIKGYIEPFKANMPNKITLIANKVEFINNNSAHLIASTKLDFSFTMDKSRLDMTGDIDIQEGNIYFDPKKPNTTKSKDVVFIENKEQDLKATIAFNPNFNLRISDGVHFTGFNLDADITGKLEINQRHKATYGTGRVTIKQGTYKIPGQTLQIQKGRLLYPPGTLLANPALDIKMLGKNQSNDIDERSPSSDLQLFVHGSAQNPVIHETGIGKNTDKAMSQALMAGSSLLSRNFLQDKLKLSELGLVPKEQQHSDFFEPRTKGQSTMKNKDLIIGRPLGKRLYLQYLHSMGETNSRVRLKYALNKNWALGLESGNKGGGADLSFAIEKD